MTDLSAHPGTDELAAYADGELEAELRPHVEACSQCAADVAAFADVRGALAALPPLSMPLDVATSLDRSLAAARQAAEPGAAPVSSLATARSRRAARIGPFAAAAAAIGLAVALGSGLPRGVDGAGNDAASGVADTAAKAGPLLLRSGTDYTADGLDGRVRELLAGPPAEALSAQAPAARNAASNPAGSGGAAEDTAAITAESAAQPEPLLDDSALQSCLEELSGSPGAQPLLVDFATFSGAPAVVVVLPFRDTTVDVYVVRPDCRVGNDALVLFKRVETAG